MCCMTGMKSVFLGALVLLFITLNQAYSFKVPIVFHEAYVFHGNVQACVTANLSKYKQVYDYLLQKKGLKKTDFYTPTKMMSYADLKKVHHAQYINQLMSGELIIDAIKNSGLASYYYYSLYVINNALLQQYLLNPYRYATQGTCDAINLVLQGDKGLENKKTWWAINLAGGYHRAYSNKVDTLCFVNDIAMGLYYLRQNEKFKKLNVLVVNLDLHAGTGLVQMCRNDKYLFTFDFYADSLTKEEKQLFRKDNDFMYKLSSRIGDKAYLKMLYRELSQVIKIIKPGLIIYNAGTDIYKNDPLNKGATTISPKGIRARDQIVFTLAKKCSSKLVMLLSGGLAEDTGSIICKSLSNLTKKKIIFLR